MANHNFFQKLFNRNDPVFNMIEAAIGLIEGECYNEAIALLETGVISRDPGNRRGLLHLGIAHMLKGDLDRAEGYLSPLATEEGKMNSEKAAAQIALERVAKLREEQAHSRDRIMKMCEHGFN